MEEYFKRQIQLWGLQKQQSLQEKSILIVGAGGLGSSLALSLGSIGIGNIVLVDFDEVATHNIHRQIAFKLEDVGKAKAEVVKELLENRSKFSKVSSFVEDFKTFSKRDFKFDLIFDATDNMRSRVEIDEYAKERNTPWIYGSVEAFYGNVLLFEKSSFSTFQQQERELLGISAPIVMLVASFQANLGIKYLLGEKVDSDKLYTISFENSTLEVRNFKMPT